MHKLFARQLAKATASTGEADLDALGEFVSAAYEEQDRDRERTDRSISLMVDELDRLNHGLETLVEERTATLRQREQELRNQNSQFDAAINNMSHALIMFDAGARLMICNNRYRSMYRLPEELTQPGTDFRTILRHRKRTRRTRPSVIQPNMSQRSAASSRRRKIFEPDRRTTGRPRPCRS